MTAPPYGKPASTVGTGDARALGAALTVEFMYQGRTALTAIGPITGARYRFNQPGARVHVDIRDAASLAQIPRLQRV